MLQEITTYFLDTADWGKVKRMNDLTVFDNLSPKQVAFLNFFRVYEKPDPHFFNDDDSKRNDGIFLDGEDMLRYPPNEEILVIYGKDKEQKGLRDTLLPGEKIGCYQYEVLTEENADILLDVWGKHRLRYRKVWDRGLEQQEILKSHFDLGVSSWDEYKNKKAVDNQKVSWKDIVSNPKKYDGDLLVTDDWESAVNILNGQIQLDIVDDWYENPLTFDFEDMDSFLLSALIFLGDEKIKLTKEQREKIIETLQAITGDYTRKVNRAHEC